MNNMLEQIRLRALSDLAITILGEEDSTHEIAISEDDDITQITLYPIVEVSSDALSAIA